MGGTTSEYAREAEENKRTERKGGPICLLYLKVVIRIF